MAACTSDIKFLLLELHVTEVNDKYLAMLCHSAKLSKFKACHVIIILLSFLLLFLLEADGNQSCERRPGSERKLKVHCPLLPIYSPRVDKTVVTADWVMKIQRKLKMIHMVSYSTRQLSAHHSCCRVLLDHHVLLQS